MATLTVRQIDDCDYALLTAAARANRRSVAAEVRDAIAEHARRQRVKAMVQDLQALRAQSKHLFDPVLDSVALVRAIREEE